MKTKVVNVHKEPYDVCIMRPSILGNPYMIGRDGTREEVIAKHKKYFHAKMLSGDAIFINAVLDLKGLRIGCCCAPKPCHGDNYVEYFEGGK